MKRPTLAVSLLWLTTELTVACRSHPPSLAFEPTARPLTKSGGRDPQVLALASGAIALLSVESSKEGGADLFVYSSRSGGDVFSKLGRLNQVPGEVMSHGEGSPLLLQGPGMQVAAAWLAISPSPNRQPAIRVSRSENFGQSFSPPVDIKGSEGTSFFGAYLSRSGELTVAWLGRAQETLPGTSGLYVSTSRDGGKTFGPPVQVARNVCPCCRPALASDPGGRLYLAWRNVTASRVRDIVLAASQDGGATWTTPALVSDDKWQIDGCPHSGPSLIVRGNELIIAWFSAPDDRSRLFWSFSSDGGLHFAPRRELAERIDSPNHPFLGLIDGDLWVAYEGREPHERQGWGPRTAFIQKLKSDSSERPFRLPAEAGSAAYPVISRIGPSAALVSWTAESDGGPSLVGVRAYTNPKR